MLDQKTLKELLHYDPDTGVFTWLPREPSLFKSYSLWASWSSARLGKPPGCLKEGYLVIGIGLDLYKAHRLAFLWMTGSFPNDKTDHINGVRNDNRWSNLRDVSPEQNAHNLARSKANSSGITGVSWMSKTSRWRAKISSNKAVVFLGDFEDKFEAICARKSAERKYGYHPNHGRKAVKNSLK